MKLALSRDNYTIFPAMPLAIAMLIFATYAVAATPSYLDDMPSVRRVLSVVKGKDALDRAARQSAVFGRLVSMMAALEGPRQFSLQKQTADEIRLHKAYIAAESRIAGTVQRELGAHKTAAKGGDMTWAKWLDTRTKYGDDTAYVLKEFFSPQWQSEYRAAALQESRVTEAGRRAVNAKISGGQNSVTVIHGFGTLSGTSRLAASITVQILMLAIVFVPLGFLLTQLRINGKATQFMAGLHRWKLTNVTGVLVSYKSYTTVHGGGGYSVGNTITPIHISSDLHEDLRIKMPDGRTWNTELVNFSFSPEVGDVVTICEASRWGSHRILGALNRTGEYSSINAQEVFAMASGGSMSQSLKGMAMVFFMVLCVIFGIIIGSFLVVAIGWMPIAIWLSRGLRIKRFAAKGLAPIWTATAGDTEILKNATLAPQAT